MADIDMYTITDAIVYCMQQPGAIAVALVETKTGRAIAGDGADKLDIDAMTPLLTELLLDYSSELIPIPPLNAGEEENSENNTVREIVITASDRVHLLYPLTKDATGLYLYLALDRGNANIPLSRVCLREVDARLHL